MADIKVGGSNGEDGLNYIGNIGEVWIDKNNKIRRSDGHTPGGVIQVLGGGTPFSGDYNDLTNKPSIPTPFSGDYNDLTNKPSIPTPFSGDYNDLTNNPTLFDGAYGSLSGRPDLTGIDSNNAAIVAEIIRAQAEETSIRTDYVAADVVVTNSANTYTDTAIANLVDTAPATLDTLNELAAALGDDANFSTTITNQIAALTHNGFADFVANEHIDWTTDQGATNIHAGNYTNTTYVSSDFNHDDLTGFVANEHIDWTQSGAGTIHASNYSSGSYSDSDVETYLSGGWDFHLLPDTNATYDIGSAEYKVRHLFLSDNSLYIGDNTLRTSGNNLLFDGEDVMDYANIKNKPAISQSTVTLPTFTTEQSNISSDDTNPTDFDPNVYSAFFVWGNFNLGRRFNLLDGSYDGQVVRIHPQRAGGANLVGTIKMFDAFTGTVVQKTSQSGGTFVWNGSCWFRTALVA